MATFKVQGGVKLKGELHPQGAKNEALQVLCAVLLTPEEVVMENVPNSIKYLKENHLYFPIKEGF